MIRLKIVVFILTFYKPTFVESLSTGSPCIVNRADVEGVCVIVTECEYIKEIQRQGRLIKNPPTICDRRERTVCCPKNKEKKPEISTFKPTTKRISEQKCEEYGRYIYKEFNYPSPIRGEADVVKKIDQCRHETASLILNGNAAKRGEFPHMALLGYQVGRMREYSCGGSLISPQFVLTSAHCLNSLGLGTVKYVKLGTNRRNLDDVYTRVFRVNKTFKHPNYDEYEQDEDIGLIKLDGNASLSERLMPICLPQTFHAPVRAIAIGFGITGYRETVSNVLLKVTLDWITQEECQTTFDQFVTITNNTMICYGHRSELKDTCNGDSGGPLQVYNDRPHCTYTQVGIISYGMKKCGMNGSAGVFVRVHHYLDWIEQIVWPDGN